MKYPWISREAGERINGFVDASDRHEHTSDTEWMRLVKQSRALWSSGNSDDPIESSAGDRRATRPPWIYVHEEDREGVFKKVPLWPCIDPVTNKVAFKRETDIGLWGNDPERDV